MKKVLKGKLMKYSLEIIINKDREQVIQSYIDYSLMPLWQKGLIRIEHNGPIHQKGSISHLVFEFDHQEMLMKETIETYDFPNLYIAIYEVPGAWNRCVNHYYEVENGTKWVMESEFIFEEENDIPLSAFEIKTYKAMELFKEFIENR